MQLNPSLSFQGNAEEVLEHYRNALGGDVVIHRYAGSPAESEVPPEFKTKVLYGMLQSPAGVIAVMDAPSGRSDDVGGNFAIAIQTDTEEQARSLFDTLLEGGNTIMPFEKTFFAERFGMLADKFGIRWMVSYAVVATPAAV